MQMKQVRTLIARPLFSGYEEALKNLDEQVNNFSKFHRIITVKRDVLLPATSHEQVILTRIVIYDGFDSYDENL